MGRWKTPIRRGGAQSPWAADGYTHGGYGHGGHGHSGYGGKPHKRRKSWLEDIFD